MGGVFRCDVDQCDHCPIKALPGDHLRPAMAIESIVAIRHEEASLHLSLDLLSKAAIQAYGLEVPQRALHFAAGLIIRKICTSKPRYEQ